jgi:hypothetical protein
MIQRSHTRIFIDKLYRKKLDIYDLTKINKDSIPESYEEFTFDAPKNKHSKIFNRPSLATL